MTITEFDPVRVGLIGCGGMGIRHARAVLEMQAKGCRAAEIVAVCDADADRRAEVSALVEANDCPRPREFAHVANLLCDARVEAVDIVLPTSLHHAMVIAALDAEKHVLVEKPLALTVAACDLVVAAAARAHRVVAVAENYRRITSNRAIGHLVRSGAFGRLDAMHVTSIAARELDVIVGGKRVAPPAWYRDLRRGGGYLVLEMGVHEADLQQSWFGDIESVSAEVSTFGDGDAYASEDLLQARFRFASGFTSHLFFCSTMPGIDVAERRLIGERVFAESRCWHAWQDGAIRHSDGRQEALEDVVAAFVRTLDATERNHLLPAGAWDEAAPRSVWGAPLTYGVGLAIHDFARAIRTGMAPEITPSTARAAVAACHAIRESAHLNEPVSVADVLSGKISASQRTLNQAIGLA